MHQPLCIFHRSCRVTTALKLLKTKNTQTSWNWPAVSAKPWQRTLSASHVPRILEQCSTQLTVKMWRSSISWSNASWNSVFRILWFSNMSLRSGSVTSSGRTGNSWFCSSWHSCSRPFGYTSHFRSRTGTARSPSSSSSAGSSLTSISS